MAMDDARRRELLSVYRDGLLEDTLPFWLPRCVDEEHGGFLFARDRDGTLLDTDKGLWQHGRFTWLLATLYNEVEPREEWLLAARHGIDFLRKHGFDEDGRMFFLVTREGQPLRKRRYLFTETFTVIALAAYAKAAGDARAAEEARELFRLVVRHMTTPGLIPPKVDADVRPSKGLGVPMILLRTAQLVRDTIGDPLADEWVGRAIAEIRADFMHPELEAVLETVTPDGELLDHFDGRLLNPGHAIEASWFLIDEANRRGGDAELVQSGTTILDWMWKRGWDEEHGGLFSFRDVRGLPVQEYSHDMKFWWPHNEAILATLYAYRATGDERYSRWHQEVHDWSYAHFADPVHGEWYGYLHRDGGVSVPLKGNLWKGPFHLPRMQLRAWQLLDAMASQPANVSVR